MDLKEIENYRESVLGVLLFFVRMSGRTPLRISVGFLQLQKLVEAGVIFSVG